MNLPKGFLDWLEDQDELIIAFTGHRPDKIGGYGRINPAYQEKTVELLDTIGIRKIRWAYDGLAQGYDWEALKACFRLGIPIVGCKPSESQHTVWPERAQRLYRAFLTQIRDGGGKLVTIQTCVNKPTVGESNYWASKSGLIEAYMKATSARHAAALLNELRNQYMVDSAGLVIACWDGSNGGTRNCIRYAEKVGVPWINIFDMKGR